MRTLTAAISPCPNDTYIFGALKMQNLPKVNFQYRFQLGDIKELNSWAATQHYDLLKVSFFAYLQLKERYQLLDAGAALGRGVGPLVVSNRPSMTVEELQQARIGIPGWNTTAHLLFHHFAPQAQNRKVLRFDEIMPAVAAKELDAGVIIHESRFTYAEHGLHKLADLGDHWEQTTGKMIPLGGIVLKNSFSAEEKHQVEADIRASLAFARERQEAIQSFISRNAQEMTPEVMQKHIELYVNEFSEQLGPEGRAAIATLEQVARDLQAQFPPQPEVEK